MSENVRQIIVFQLNEKLFATNLDCIKSVVSLADTEVIESGIENLLSIQFNDGSPIFLIDTVKLIDEDWQKDPQLMFVYEFEKLLVGVPIFKIEKVYPTEDLTELVNEIQSNLYTDLQVDGYYDMGSEVVPYINFECAVKDLLGDQNLNSAIPNDLICYEILDAFYELLTHELIRGKKQVPKFVLNHSIQKVEAFHLFESLKYSISKVCEYYRVKFNLNTSISKPEKIEDVFFLLGEFFKISKKFKKQALVDSHSFARARKEIYATVFKEMSFGHLVQYLRYIEVLAELLLLEKLE